MSGGYHRKGEDNIREMTIERRRGWQISSSIRVGGVTVQGDRNGRKKG